MSPPEAGGLDAGGLDAAPPDTAWRSKRLVGRTDGESIYQVEYPRSVARHPITGALYIGRQHQVLRLEADGRVTRVAGTGVPGYEGDGGPGRLALFNTIHDIEFDPAGRLYIADTGNDRIRRIDEAGVVDTLTEVAATQSFAADGEGRVYVAINGHGALYRLGEAGELLPVVSDGVDGVVIPTSQMIAVSPDGRHLFYATGFSGAVYRVETTGDPNPVLVAGAPDPGGEDLTFAYAAGIVVDERGHVVISDGRRFRLLRAVPTGPDTYRVERFAGTGIAEPGVEGLHPRDTSLYGPGDMTLAADGSVIVNEYFAHRVWRIDPDGLEMSVIAGTGSATPDSVRTQTTLWLNALSAVLAEDNGDVLIADHNQVWRRAADGAVSLVAGTVTGFGGDGDQAGLARFDGIADMTLDALGGLVLADFNNHRIRRVAPGADGRVTAQGRVETIVGSGGTRSDEDEGRPPTEVALGETHGVERGFGDEVYISDSGASRLRVLVGDTLHTAIWADEAQMPYPLADPDLAGPGRLAKVELSDGPIRWGAMCYLDWGRRTISCHAPGAPGGGAVVYLSGPGDLEQPPYPNAPTSVGDLAADGQALYVSSPAENRVLRVATDLNAAPEDAFQPHVGTGERASVGDGAPPEFAGLANPKGIAIDRQGRLLIAESIGARVRRIDFTPGSERVETIAGFIDPLGVGPRDRAWLQSPTALAPDGDGGWYVAGGPTGRIVHLPRVERPDNQLRVVVGRPYGFADVDAWRAAWAGAPPSPEPPADVSRRLYDAVGVAYDAEGAAVYALERGNGADIPPGLRRLDLRRGTVRTVWQAPDDVDPRALAFDAERRIVYLASADTVWRLPLPLDGDPPAMIGGRDGIAALAARGGAVTVLTSGGVYRLCDGEECEPGAVVETAVLDPTAIALGEGEAVFYAAADVVWRVEQGAAPAVVYRPIAGAPGPAGLAPQRITGLAWDGEHLVATEGVFGQLIEVTAPDR